MLQLRALSLHRLDPHNFYRPPMTASFAMLGHLTQLQELAVAHSHALELPPGLSRLTNLTYLSLRNTHWRQGDLEAILAPLTALRAVDLSYQDLPSLPAPVVGLSGLRALAVAGGQFPLRQGLYCHTVSFLLCVPCEILQSGAIPAGAHTLARQQLGCSDQMRSAGAGGSVSRYKLKRVRGTIFFNGKQRFWTSGQI